MIIVTIGGPGKVPVSVESVVIIVVASEGWGSGRILMKGGRRRIVVEIITRGWNMIVVVMVWMGFVVSRVPRDELTDTAMVLSRARNLEIVVLVGASESSCD